MKEPPRSADPHMNLFAPYGSHRFLENNITAAVAKLLHYGGEGARRSCLRDFIRLPGRLPNPDYS